MFRGKNRVIQGKYNGCGCTGGCVYKSTGFMTEERYPFRKETVEYYSIISEASSVSATSALTRGAIGAAFLGPVGIAAAVTAKRKGIHTVFIQWKDGEKSVIQLDDHYFFVFKTRAKTEGIPCEN